jgi:hypothetical protein
VFTTVAFDNTIGAFGQYGGMWETPIGAGPNDDQPFGLSHLTFFDTRHPGGGGGTGGGGGGSDTPVPAPAALALSGIGLLGLGFARRRRGA